VGKFGEELAKQQAKSREDYLSRGITFSDKLVNTDIKTEFKGYNDNFSIETELLRVIPLEEKDQMVAILKETPFYAESGGQIGDKGLIRNSDFEFVVEDSQKQGDAVLHIGRNKAGDINQFIGKKVTVKVEDALRETAIRFHTF